MTKLVTCTEMWQSFVAIKNTCAGDMGKSPSTTAAENARRCGHKGELRDEKGPPPREQGAAYGRAGHSPTVIIHGRGPRENLFDAPGGEKPSVCAVTGLERLETKCQ